MKILKGLLNYKFNSCPAQKLSLAFLVLFLSLLIGISCNEKNEYDSQPVGIEPANLSASTGSTGTESKAFSTGLGNLYLENFNDPSRNQLAKLLSNESYKKLVFQFYKLKNGRLTLVAFAGKLNNKDYNPNYQVLGIVDDVIVQDIEDKEVFLGDQKLDNDAGFKLLKDAINQGSKNDTSKNYVIFTPELKRFSASGTYVVEYSINFTNSLRGFSNQTLPVGSRRLNPSPPY